jgi:Phospholipase_D-nuclease N-terminal
MSVTLPSTLQMILGLYAYLLPMLLYVLWSTLALWDLGRRDELPATKAWAWAFAIFLLPFVGALGYLLFGATKLASRVKVLAFGGAAVYVLVLALGAGIGGIS